MSTPGRRMQSCRQVPRDRALRERGLDGVRVRTWLKRGRLVPAPRIGREVVLALERRDTGAVRIVVAEVGDEPVPRRLDALEGRRDRVGRRLGRRDRVAAVLPDRLAPGAPVIAAREHMLPCGIHPLVWRDDVAPVIGGIRRPLVLVIEVTSLEVAVVRDRGRVFDVRVALRTGRVADPHLLFVVQSGGRHDRDRGEKCQPEAEREKRAGSDLLAARAGLRHSLAATLAACAAGDNHPIDTARGGVRTS